MAYNNLVNDVSLQQFPELWESSRYTHRISTDPDSLRHMLDKTEHRLPDLSLCEMPNRRRDMDDDRGVQHFNLQATDSIAEECTATKNFKEIRGDEEENKDELPPKLGTPSWLSNALMRQRTQVSVSEGSGVGVVGTKCSSCGSSGAHCICGNMQTSSPPQANHPYTDWLSAVPIGSTHPEDASGELPGGQRKQSAGATNRYLAPLNPMSKNSRGQDHQGVILGLHMESGSGNNAGGDHGHERDENKALSPVDRLKNWQEARMKAKMLTHPLFSQMLAAHVQCLRIATPVDQLPKIEEQLAQSQNVIDKYAVLAPGEEDVEDKEELDAFMEQLQTHVRVHATEAMVGCWELEQQLFTLTGVAPGSVSGSGATMSDDDDEQAAESDGGGFETGLEVQDSSGVFGPLVPTENERSLMERVRQELKLELNEQGYREKIVDVREEILRKRRAGKLPEGTTTVLKTWWSAHSKWPYPTEDEKERLLQETGLELKQVNNWFINQRKRNWHSNPLSSSNELKNKRKF